MPACMAALRCAAMRRGDPRSQLLSCMLHGNHGAEQLLCTTGLRGPAPPDHRLLPAAARRSCWGASPRAHRTTWSA